MSNFKDQTLTTHSYRIDSIVENFSPFVSVPTIAMCLPHRGAGVSFSGAPAPENETPHSLVFLPFPCGSFPRPKVPVPFRLWKGSAEGPE